MSKNKTPESTNVAIVIYLKTFILKRFYNICRFDLVFVYKCSAKIVTAQI